jgi:hypothetical protein
VRTAELRLAWTGYLADMISSQRRATPHIIDVPPLEWWWMDLARKLPARHGTAGDYQKSVPTCGGRARRAGISANLKAGALYRGAGRRLMRCSKALQAALAIRHG